MYLKKTKRTFVKLKLLKQKVSKYSFHVLGHNSGYATYFFCKNKSSNRIILIIILRKNAIFFLSKRCRKEK